MTLILFEIEGLKSKVFGAVEGTHKILSWYNELSVFNEPPRGSKKNNKKKTKIIWGIVEKEKILTAEEIKEVECLIDYRNEIAHRIHLLLCDVTSGRGQVHIQQAYNYDVLERTRHFHRKINSALQGKLIAPLSLAPVHFEPVEKVLQEELLRLTKKIERQLEERKSTALSRGAKG